MAWKRKHIIVMVITTSLFCLLVIAEIYLCTPFTGHLKGFLVRTFAKPPLLQREYYADLSYSIYANYERAKFYDMYAKKEGKYGLKQKIGTDYNTDIYIYLFTDNGRLTQIVDKTYHWRSHRRYDISYPIFLEIGYIVEPETTIILHDAPFVKADPNEICSKDIYLKPKFAVERTHTQNIIEWGHYYSF